MRIAVYSGSFDPLHIGHKAVMEYLTSERKFDWVYLVISPQNPFKDASKALTGEQRYESAIEAVRRCPELHVWVDNIELSMTPPHYTVRTLDELSAREPENHFTLVIGADNLIHFREWKGYERILLEYGLIVYPRTGADMYALVDGFMKENPAYRIDMIEAPLVDISSTRIREGLEGGEDMSEFLM